jgi:hypothetical protein
MDEKFTKGTNLECLEGPATVQQQEKSMEGWLLNAHTLDVSK